MSCCCCGLSRLRGTAGEYLSRAWSSAILRSNFRLRRVSTVDVLWVATKATQLEDALTLAPAEVVGDAVVVPLLNGVDHL